MLKVFCKHFRWHYENVMLSQKVSFEAVKEVDLTLPLVVRLEGTNVELGKNLKDSGLAIEPAATMAEGAQKNC